MHRGIAGGLLIGALACTPTQPPPTKPVTEPEPEPPVVAVEVDEPEPEPAATEDLLIGITRPPTLPKEARKTNRQGLKLHENGDYEASRAKFALAVELEPEHDMARFNLACALSRLGREAEAAAEVTTLLTRDPLRVHARIHEDEDLASLRSSAHWEAIQDHWGRVDAALDRAFEQGVPSMFYRYSAPLSQWAGPDRGGTKGLVAGLYLHDQRRFVPLGRKGTFMHVDASRRRLTKIDSDVWEGIVHSMWRSSTLWVVSADPKQAFSVSTTMDEDGPHAVGHPEILETWEDDNAGFEMGMVLVPRETGLWIDLTWHTHAGDEYEKKSTLALTSTGLALTRDPMPPQGTRIMLTYEGVAFYDPPPLDHVLDKRRYQPVGRASPIELSRRHARAAWQSVALSHDGRFALVTGVEHREGPRFEEGEDGILRHVVDLVDLEAGTVRTLAQAPGTAYATFGPDDAIYVDSEGTVSRWDTPQTEQSEAVVEGLRIAPPLLPYVCGLCG